MKISDNTLQTMQSINQLIAFVNPLLAGAIALGEAIVADVRGQGANIEGFDVEIAKFDAAVSGGVSADDAWRARHGLAPWAGGQAPAQPSSPAAPAEPSSPDLSHVGSGADDGGFPVAGGQG